ncbi:hypothetical protein Tco_1426436, partial [Tanacetum coccineum]
MIGKINLLWKTESEKLNNVSTPKNAGNPMAPKSIAAISHDEREELRKKGIKSPSKLLSLKYLSPADTEEEDVSLTNACNLNLGGMERGKEEVKEQGMEENEMKADLEVDEVSGEKEGEFFTDEEVEEILEEENDNEDDENFNSFPTMKELTHHEWLLKNPRPPWMANDNGLIDGVAFVAANRKMRMNAILEAKENGPGLFVDIRARVYQCL